MAINRFMQPWRREIKSEFYSPNIDAWAKLIDKKDTEMEETLAGADKLSSLIPEAGLRLREDREKYMAEINRKKSELVQSLYETGNASEARRQIRGLSSEILAAPRISKYNIDKTMMPEAIKIINSQTRDTDIYGVENDEWLDKENGQVKQLGWEEYNPETAYAYVATKNTNKYFFEMGEPIKATFSQFKTLGKELVAKSYYDEETGKETVKYFLEGISGSDEGIDVHHLMQYLDPDGKFGAYAKELYRNSQDEARAYWDAKYRHLSEEERETKFYEDLLAANYSRIYSKTTSESFVQPVGTGKGGGSDEEESDDMAIVTGTTGIGLHFENLESAGQMLFHADETRSKIETLKSTEVEKANSFLAPRFGGKPVIIRDGKGGKFKINPEYQQNLTLEQGNAIYGEKLGDILGTTVHDFIANSNDELLSLRQTQEMYDEILLEAGLDNATSKRVLKDLWGQALSNATSAAKANAHQGENWIAGDSGQETTLTSEQLEKIRNAKPTEEQVNAEFNKLLEKSEHEELKILNSRINERKQTIYDREVTTYFPLGATNSDQNKIDGITTAIQTIMTNNLLEIKIPGEDKYLDADKLAVVSKVLNNHFSGDKEDFFKRYNKSFQVFMDPEESRYKLLVNVNNDAISKELGYPENSIVQLEVPIDNTFITKDGRKFTLEEHLNIESDQDILQSLRKTERDFADKGLYTSVQNGDNGEKYIIKADVIASDPSSKELKSTFKVKFDDNTTWGANVVDPREAATLKKIISKVAQVPRDAEGAYEKALQILEYYMSRDQLPSLSGKDTDALYADISQWLGKGVGTLNENSDFYTLSPTLSSKNIDKKLEIGLESFAGGIWAGTGAKIKVNEVHDPERDNPESSKYNPSSRHLTGEAFDISWSSPEERDKIVAQIQTMLAGDNITFKPSKSPYRLKKEFGGLKIFYETPETNPKATGVHIHVSK